MCLLSHQTEPKIATEDIVCYKLLFDGYTNRDKDFPRGYYSIVQHYRWRFHKLYECVMHVSKAYESPVVEVNQGFHAMMYNEENYGWNYNVIAKAIIPKGALYYEGNSNDIVSNQMRLVKIVHRV